MFETDELTYGYVSWGFTEDLGEARLGIRLGDQRWFSIAAVRGWTLVSPDLGLMVQWGTRF